MPDLGPGDVYIAPAGTSVDGDGWTYIGHTEGPVELTMPPAVDPTALPLRVPAPVTVTITGDNTAFLAAMYRVLHDLDRWYRPRRHGHCDTCHPEMAPRPLAVNGREYHRRQLARAARRRR